MKTIIVILGVLLAGLRPASALEAPTLFIGDKWIYRAEKGGDSITREIVGADEHYYVLRVSRNENENVYLLDKETLNIEKERIGGTFRKSPGYDRRLLNFPLFGGKEWSEGFAEKTQITTCRYSCSNVMESVETPTGKFNNCFKIEFVQIATVTGLGYGYDGKAVSGKKILWFSPEVKWIVKCHVDFWQFSKGLRPFNYELISYSLK